MRVLLVGRNSGSGLLRRNPRASLHNSRPDKESSPCDKSGDFFKSGSQQGSGKAAIYRWRPRLFELINEDEPRYDVVCDWWNRPDVSGLANDDVLHRVEQLSACSVERRAEGPGSCSTR